MEPLLRVQKLTKTYKRTHLGNTTLTRGVVDVSFDVQPGEVFGLLGLNGSGKTTTLKLILGLLFPTQGTIKLYGRAMPNLESQKKLGYLPEVPYFYRHLTPLEVLTLYGTLSGMKPALIRSRAEQVLSMVRMEAAQHQPMKEFSKGMLQRVGFAQALLHDPDFLVLDEPMTGLDPLGIRQTRDLIIDLAKKGKTILFSSHSLSELEKLSHRVAIMAEGKIAKIVHRDEWRYHPGQLEEIFIGTLGPLGIAL